MKYSFTSAVVITPNLNADCIFDEYCSIMIIHAMPLYRKLKTIFLLTLIDFKSVAHAS
ncbi:hypothetical protein T03_13300 [Trichinella britovi]|uniref:Uncharacterized protein n=1 Tax=Trichinella britovi TaxID=45882 RepID=A0A0V1C638_TRIBR|nr:hypothetical protein T03_13300 [Trichinella britovi]